MRSEIGGGAGKKKLWAALNNLASRGRIDPGRNVFPLSCLQEAIPSGERKGESVIEASFSFDLSFWVPPLLGAEASLPPSSLCALVRADGKGRREEKEAGRS